MRNFSFAGNLNKVWMLALVAFMVACSQFEAPGPDDVNLENAEELASAFRLTPFGMGLENARTASTPVSDGGITPDIIDGANPGGNRTCDEVATAYGITGFENSFDQIDAEDFDGNKATFGAVTATTDGTFVSWNIEVPDGYCVKYLAAVVKGSNDANVYFYEGDIRSDSGLASPEAGQSGGAAGLSNLRFCYTLVECDTPPGECWEDETAWAAGTRYITRGNWATYSSKSALEAGVTLFAGQTLDAGTVQLVDGIIVITLNDGWRFADTDENVKIQHYSSTPPAENPAPGLFATKGKATESPFEIAVPYGKFYGVHVDVEREVECPVEE